MCAQWKRLDESDLLSIHMVDFELEGGAILLFCAQKWFYINLSKLDLYLTFSSEKHYYMYVHAFICNKLFIR